MTLPVMIWMYRRDQRKALPQKNPGKRNGMVPAYALLAVMGISACIAMNALLMMAGLPDSSEGYRQVSETMYQSPLWIQVLGLGILIPAKEEMVYRAVFYGRMRESVPVKEAILISSALFGIGHGNLVQFFFAAVMGALLAGVYELSASACAPVFLHSIINLTSLVLTWTGCFAWVMGGALRAATVTVVSASVAAGMYWGYRSILK